MKTQKEPAFAIAENGSFSLTAFLNPLPVLSKPLAKSVLLYSKLRVILFHQMVGMLSHML